MNRVESETLSGRRSFLDVGAHLGETLAEVVKPAWAFDVVVAFEPSKRNLPALEPFASERVSIVDAGWWTCDTELDLHDPGAIGASVHGGKALGTTVERCRFVDKNDWLERNRVRQTLYPLKSRLRPQRAR